MDAELVQQLIESNRPFVVRTAAGDTYHVPHTDFVILTRNRTELIINYDENGESRIAMVPLRAVTALDTADLQEA